MSEAPRDCRSARVVAVPDTRLHPIYLVIETAKTVR